MSVSRWAYVPALCDGGFCPGDCDCCPKLDENLAAIEEAEEEEPDKIS